MLQTANAISTAACAQALTGVEAHSYDCIQSNLAVLADAAHGRGTAHRMGAQLLIEPRPSGDGLYTMDPDPADEATRCAALVGLLADGPDLAVAAGQLRDAVGTQPCYAVGDAFEMPWLPYYRQAHMPHSFLVAAAGPDAWVLDAYDNQTEWGAAEPGSWRRPWSELDFPVRLWRWQPAPLGPSADRRSERRGIEDYLAALRNHPDRARAWDQFAIDTWLLARRHRLFAHAYPDDPAAEQVAERWERLAADAFLGLRRVRRGRPEPAEPLAEAERLLAEPR